jgi:hypothetical protein
MFGKSASILLAAALLFFTLGPAHAVCKKGPDLPDCANFKITPSGKSVTIENNCSYDLRIHVDKRGRFCPDFDDNASAGETFSYDTSKCRFAYVRQCRK